VIRISISRNFPYSKRLAAKLSLAWLLPLLLASVCFAGTVSGTVTNGTTGQPAAGVQVILIQLQGTMQPVANTTTDAKGHYQITSDVLGTAPMLLRAVYRGVNYHQPVPVGTTNADLEVFEPTDKTTAFSITAHAIILQPTGTDLEVGEEFNIVNNTTPPVAYYRAGGSFLFTLPAGAQVSEVSAGGSAGMPVLQTPIDKGNGVQGIDFPFRPGDSEVRITYHVPYPSNATTLKTSSPYDATNVAYFAAPSMKVTADGFSAAGQEQGYIAYLRKSVPANTKLTASISGTAPPPSNVDTSTSSTDSSASADNSQNPAVNSRVETDNAAAAASVTTMPARLDSLKWIVVAGFAAIFSLGAAFIMRKPQPVIVADGGVQVAAVSGPAIPPVVAPIIPRTVGDLDKAIGSSLDELKDALFRLELRHQAGTVSADDYARERQRIDQKLRDLVQG
jgi:hypothetical protein